MKTVELNPPQQPGGLGHRQANGACDSQRDQCGQCGPLDTAGFPPDGPEGGAAGEVQQGKQHHADSGQPGPAVLNDK